MDLHSIKKSVLLTAISLAFVISNCTIAKGQEQSVAPASCCSIVTDALRAIDQIKVGSSRADIERAFKPDGGIFTREQTVYVFRRCNTIKMKIAFSLDTNSKDFASGAPTDRATSVSKPYVEYGFTD
jgi:hypothetical protein